MISIELARELRDAGLVWEPKEGDAYWLHGDGEIFFRIDGISDAWKEKEIDSTLRLYRVAPECLLWAPYLSQLLAEIEKRGYGYTLRSDDDRLCSDFAYMCNVRNLSKPSHVCDKKAGTPEDAAAKALIWILRGERG